MADLTITDNLESATKEIRTRLAKRLNAAAQFWVGTAQEGAPVRTGFLISHILQTEVAGEDDLAAGVNSLAPYSRVQDTGSATTPGTLFWTNAYIQTKSGFHDILMGDADNIGSVKTAETARLQRNFRRAARGGVLTGKRTRGGWQVRNRNTGVFQKSYKGPRL